MFDVTDGSIQTVTKQPENKVNDFVNVVRQLEDKIETLRKSFHASRASSARKSPNRQVLLKRIIVITINTLVIKRLNAKEAIAPSKQILRKTPTAVNLRDG